MLKLYNIAKYLILEAISRNQIMDSIRKRSIVAIYYAGDETINKGYREIEPVAYGDSLAGNPVVRAWQIRGATDTPDNMPGWRFFRVDRIVNWNNTLQTFNTPRPNYNPNGDRSMSRVYLNAVFPIDQEMYDDI